MDRREYLDRLSCMMLLPLVGLHGRKHNVLIFGNLYTGISTSDICVVSKEKIVIHTSYMPRYITIFSADAKKLGVQLNTHDQVWIRPRFRIPGSKGDVGALLPTRCYGRRGPKSAL
jgi:hypothetical protein